MLNDGEAKELRYFLHEIKIPTSLVNCDSYDFVYDNSIAAGFVTRYLKGEKIADAVSTLLSGNAIDRIREVLDTVAGNNEREKVERYLESYKRIVTILEGKA